MKTLIMIFFFISSARATEATLTSSQAQLLLKKIQSCSTDKCWNESLSTEVSALEKSRTREWLKKFTIGESQTWRPCNFKLRPAVKDEICFSQPESLNKDEEVRILFQREGVAWRLKHLSLPSPSLGW